MGMGEGLERLLVFPGAMLHDAEIGEQQQVRGVVGLEAHCRQIAVLGLGPVAGGHCGVGHAHQVEILLIVVAGM